MSTWYNIRIGKLQLLKVPASELMVGDVVTVVIDERPTYSIIQRIYPGPIGQYSDIVYATNNGFHIFKEDQIVWRVETFSQIFWRRFYDLWDKFIKFLKEKD